MRKLIFVSVFAFLFFIFPLFILPVFAQSLSDRHLNSSEEYAAIMSILNRIEQKEEHEGLNDIPNYIAIPISIVGGFGIALLVQKFFPTATEIHLAENQRVLLEKSIGPVLNAITTLNQALSIHEKYDNDKNSNISFSSHAEDQRQLEELRSDFLRYRDILSEINSNSVGEIFYNALMKFFDNGQLLIFQGYVEYKFFIRTCEGLKVITSYIKKLHSGAFKESLELRSYGEIVDLTEF